MASAALIVTACAPAEAIFGKIGSEFQANTDTTGYHAYPGVAAEASGAFLIVWEDGPSGDVRGQRYDSSGMLSGTEFTVNAETPGFQGLPAVAATPTGSYVAVWDDDRAGLGLVDVFRNSVVGSAPYFPSDVLVNTYTTNYQGGAAVAVLNDGSAVIVWESSAQDGSGPGIFGQRLTSAGSAIGTEFQVNSYTLSFQLYPSVAARGDGGFIVVWSGSQSADSNGVAARFYDSSGVPQGTEVQVNTYITGDQERPAVATDASGVSVVVWESEDGPNARPGIFARRFSTTGAPLGTQFTVDDTDPGYSPAVTAGPSSFLVVWNHDNGIDIRGQRIDASGNLVGIPLSVSTNPGSVRHPAVAADAAGGFVVAWYLDQGYDSEIAAQRLGDFLDLCPSTPQSGCRTAGKSVLVIKDNGDNAKDKLIWKWIRGTSTTEAELGDPTSSRNYALCVYAADGLLISADVPPHATKWQDLKYKDSSGSADGVQRIILKPSASGKTKVLVKGKGTSLPDTTLGSLTLPITAQVINDESGVCFEAVYAAPQIIKNDATQFKAKSGT